MYALVKDNAVVKLFTGTTQFEDKDGIGYAPSYLQQWTTAEKKDHGIYEVVYGTSADGRFYNVVENAATFANDIVTVTFTSTPKELEDGPVSEITGKAAPGLKTQWINQFKQTANSMLNPTDWMVVRLIERQVAIPDSTAAYRTAVLSETTRLNTAVAAVTTVEELIGVVNSATYPTAE
jgi:hypothetical protein